MNKNEKNSKLRVFFWLVPLPKGRYRRQAPYADVPETLGLRGGPKNSQKWPKMAKNDHKREKINKTHQNRHISSIFGLIAQSEDEIRG